jgi:mono/diheme cytochrome c family protein
MVPAGIPRWWRDASFFCALELGTMTRWVLCGSALLAAAVMADEKVQTELYTVVDGTKVDEKTMQGFRAWRAAACDRCHGANQEGMVGPSLLESMKVLSKEEFRTIIMDGRLEKGMPSFNTSRIVSDNLDNLYAYLKGRSDGAIKRAKVELLK